MTVDKNERYAPFTKAEAEAILAHPELPVNANPYLRAATLAGKEKEGKAAGLPDDNPKTAFGATKAPLHLVPPSALYALGQVFGLGARKYGAYNWRRQAVSSSVYQAAALRHLMAYWDGEDKDAESGESHLAHVMACCAIILDADRYGKLNDDRPNTGRGGIRYSETVKSAMADAFAKPRMTAAELAAGLAATMEKREAEAKLADRKLEPWEFPALGQWQNRCLCVACQSRRRRGLNGFDGT